MRITWAVAMLAGVLCGSPLVGKDRRAKTEDGKTVILRDDGTWSFEEDEKKGKKEKKTVLAYRGKGGRFTMRLPPNVWKKAEKSGNEAAEVQFSHKEGDTMAMIVAERLEVPLPRLKKIAMSNLLAVDKNAKIIKEEKRTINGKEGLFLVINAKVQDIAFTYMNFYYTGEEGSYQIITWTGQNVFKEAKPDMDAFLEGFHLAKKKVLPRD